MYLKVQSTHFKRNDALAPKISNVPKLKTKFQSDVKARVYSVEMPPPKIVSNFRLSASNFPMKTKYASKTPSTSLIIHRHAFRYFYDQSRTPVFTPRALEFHAKTLRRNLHRTHSGVYGANERQIGLIESFRFEYEYDFDYEIRHFGRQLLASSGADVIKS